MSVESVPDLLEMMQRVMERSRQDANSYQLEFIADVSTAG